MKSCFTPFDYVRKGGAKSSRRRMTLPRELDRLGPPPGGMANLERFREAQEHRPDGFAAALGELRAGRKTGHWIWYIFPQLAGLGSSPVSLAYSLSNAGEAEDYLRDPVLRERLVAVTAAVAERLRAGQSLSALMGARVDVLKLVSSLTLFEAVSRRLEAASRDAGYQRVADVAGEVLEAAGQEGCPRCAFTLRTLSAPGTRL